MNTRTLLGIRKWLSVIGILSVLSSLVVIPAASAAVGDVYPDWATAQTEALFEKGCRDKTVKLDPNAGVTRGAAAVILFKCFGEDSGLDVAELEEDFEDVDPSNKDHWFGEAVVFVANAGWMYGSTGTDGKRMFNPGVTFTKEQFAVVLWAMAGHPEVDASEYEDAEGFDTLSDWAVMGAAFAKTANDGEPVLFSDNFDAQAPTTNAVINVSVVAVSTAVDEGVFGDEGALVYEPTDIPGGDDDDTGDDDDDDTGDDDDDDAGDDDTTGDDTTGDDTVTPPPPPGSASFAIDSSFAPTLVWASGTAFNKLMKFNVTAGPEADVKLNGLTVTRGGLSSNANVAGVGIYDMDDVRHGNIGTSWNDNNAMDIDFTSEPIVVEKGTTEAVWLKVNLASGNITGTLTLSLPDSTAVKSDATLSGTFPITSSAIDFRNGATTVATVTVDAVQVHNNGAADTTAVNINLGTTSQHLATFRLANSAVEAVKLKSLTLYNNGSAADGDVKNLILKGPDGADLVTVAAGTTSKYATFALDYELAKSASTKDFKVYGDVMTGSTRTFRPLIQNDYDLVVEGQTSGAQILPTLVGGATPNGNDQAFPVGDRSGANFINMVTVSAGTLSFSRASDSPTGNIAAGGSGLVLGRWELKATGEDMEIRQFAYTIVRSAATNLSGTLYFKVREAGSTSTSTIYSIAGADADYDGTTTFTTTFTKLTGGKTYYLEAIGDILSTAAAGTTYVMSVIDITQVKRMSTNDIVDPTVTATSANTLTVRTGTLTVTANSGAVAPQVVSGQSALTTLSTWDFTAGAGEGITLTTVVVDDNTDGLGRNFKDLEIWIDGAKKSQDTSTTQSPTATTQTVTFNISPSYTIPASQTAVVELKGKLLTATTDATAIPAIDASGVSGNGATSQTALSAVPAADVNGQTVTISAAGTLTVTRDTVTNVKSSQIVAGTTNVTFGAYKFQTGNIEDVRIKRITVRNIGSNTNGLVNLGVYDGATLLNDDAATTVNEGIVKASLGADASVLGNDPKSVTFDYTASPYVVSKNTFKVLSIKANTVYGATTAETAQLVIDSVEAEGVGSNARIYVAQTTDAAADGTDLLAGVAYALGEVIIASNGTAAGITASPVTTAVASGVTLDVIDALIDGVDLSDGTAANSATDYQLTKMNPVMNGSTILTELASTAAVYPYAVGDVVVINDADVAANNNFHVVTDALAIGGNLQTAGNLVNNMTLAATDRITRVPGGFSETTLATAETVYNLGDILAVTDDDTPANNGLYVVTNAVAVGATMIGTSFNTQVVQAQSGTLGGAAILVTGDRVTKMPTQSTELVTTAVTSTYAYSVGDVVVIDDDSTPANNGSYVVETALAVGGTLVGADALGTGVTFANGDRISKLYVKGQEDNLKRLYPSKLNFAWNSTGAGAPSGLSTNNGLVVASFILGADAANVNNPGASVAVTALNFTSLSTARLTRLQLNDFTDGAVVTGTNGANSSSFSSTAAGGSLSTLTFNQGAKRTFQILADVSTNVTTSQSAQFKFNAGTQFTAGSATWTVTNNSVTSAASTWTALESDVADLNSTSVASAITADTVAPTVIIAATAGTVNDDIINETFTVTFSERPDPITINTSLAFGGSVAAVAATATGGIVSPTATALDVTITGIAQLTGNTASNATATNGTVTLALAAYSACTTTCVLTITPTGYSLWHSVAGSGDTGAQTVAATSYAVRDTAGNLVTATGSTSTGIADL